MPADQRRRKTPKKGRPVHLNLRNAPLSAAGVSPLTQSRRTLLSAAGIVADPLECVLHLGYLAGYHLVFKRERLDTSGTVTSVCMASFLKSLTVKHWLTFFTTLLECLVFAGVIYGWASLVFVLKVEGYFSYLCVNRTSNGTEVLDCSGQDERLNLAYTISSFMVNFMTLPNGFFFDQFGTRTARLVGTCLFTGGTLMMAFSSELPMLVFPALPCLSVGGNLFRMTNFQVANLFGPSRSTIITLYNGAVGASSAVFLVIKVLYENGISILWSFLFLAACAAYQLTRTFLLMPVGRIPYPPPDNFEYGLTCCKKPTQSMENITEDMDGEMPTEEQTTMDNDAEMTTEEHITVDSDDEKPKDEHIILGSNEEKLKEEYIIVYSDEKMLKEEYIIVFSDEEKPKDKQKTINIDAEKQKTVYIDAETQTEEQKTEDSDAEEQKPVDGDGENTTERVEDDPERQGAAPPPAEMSFRDCVKSRFFLFHLVWLSVQQLRNYLFIGTVNYMLQRLTGRDAHLVSQYTNAFAITQLCGVLFAPLNGLILDRNKGKPRPEGQTEQEADMRATVVSLFVTPSLCLLFSICAAIPHLQLQYFTFVLQVFNRSFISGGNAAFISIAFPSCHFGKLYGLVQALSAVFGLLQYACFAIVNEILDGDPLYVNIGLTVLSLFAFTHPVSVLLHCRSLAAQRALRTSS